MIDYHLHLWPHGTPDHGPTVEELAEYCDKAKENGVVEIALTEHLFRFGQTEKILGDYFKRFPESPMRTLMDEYWHDHAKADLDKYVEVVLEAKEAGLPIVLGMEVDYYEDSMDRVQALLEGYPFDVLLGSVHWINDWPFDHVGDPQVMAYWDTVGVEEAWEGYTRALEELSATGSVDVLAHPDLVKVAGFFPAVPQEYYARMAEAAAGANIVAEVSSAGWRKPVREMYPDPTLLRYFFQRGVPITTASDSHGIVDVGFRTSDVKEKIIQAGYTQLETFRSRTRNSLKIVSDLGD